MDSDDTHSSSLEFPIPLDSVLSVTLNVENLKVVLEFLLGVVKNHDSRIMKLQQGGSPHPRELPSELHSQELSPEEQEPAIDEPRDLEEPQDPEELVEHQIAQKMTTPPAPPVAHPPFDPSRLHRRIEKRKTEVKSETLRNNQQDELLAMLTAQLTAMQVAMDQQGRRVDTTEEAVISHQKSLRDHESRLSFLESHRADPTPRVILREDPSSSPQQTPHDQSDTREDTSLSQRLLDLESRFEVSESRLSDLNSEFRVTIKALYDVVERTDSSLTAVRDTVTAVDGLVKGIAGELRDVQTEQHRLDTGENDLKSAQQASERLAKDLETRLHAVEKNSRVTEERSLENKENIEGLKRLIKQLEEQVRDKADADALDMLKSAMISISNKSGGGAAMSMMPTKDSNLLHELNRKVATIEDSLARLGGSGVSSSKMTDIGDRLDSLEKLIKSKASSEDLEMMLGLIKRHRSDMDKLEQVVRELEDRPTHVLSMDSLPNEGAKVDSTKLIRLTRRVDGLEETVKAINIPDPAELNKVLTEAKRLWEAVEDLKSAIEKLRKETQARLRELEDLLSRKADMVTIQDLERKRLT